MYWIQTNLRSILAFECFIIDNTRTWIGNARIISVIDHPCYGAQEVYMATTGEAYSIACKLQIGVC